MKKTLLYSILISFCLMLTINHSVACESKPADESVEPSYEFKLTEREAAKIAYSDFIKQSGEVMIPELCLRVTNIIEENNVYCVTLAIYEKESNKIVHECAVYYINAINGRIISVKKLSDSSTESYSEMLASEIICGNYSSADLLLAKLNTCPRNESALYFQIFENAKHIAMAKIIKGEGGMETVSKYFDNIVY